MAWYGVDGRPPASWIYQVPLAEATVVIAHSLGSLRRARDFGLIDKLLGIIGAQTAAADTLEREQGIIKTTDIVVSISTASAIKFTEVGVSYHAQSKDDFANPYVVAGAIWRLSKRHCSHEG